MEQKKSGKKIIGKHFRKYKVHMHRLCIDNRSNNQTTRKQLRIVETPPIHNRLERVCHLFRVFNRSAVSVRLQASRELIGKVLSRKMTNKIKMISSNLKNPLLLYINNLLLQTGEPLHLLENNNNNNNSSNQLFKLFHHFHLFPLLPRSYHLKLKTNPVPSSIDLHPC